MASSSIMENTSARWRGSTRLPSLGAEGLNPEAALERMESRKATIRRQCGESKLGRPDYNEI
jgi:hypothetical protein